MLQRLVYSRVPAMQRRQIHKAAAERLENENSGIISIELMAYHWSQVAYAPLRRAPLLAPRAW